MEPAHQQQETHKYLIHYPDHYPRQTDPHYPAFEAYRKAHIATAKCHYADVTGDASQCQGGLELHHRIIEFALQNAVDFARLSKDYPALTDPSQVAAWVESEPNFRFYCEFHHRGHAGVHVASSSDFEASYYVKDLIS